MIVCVWVAKGALFKQLTCNREMALLGDICIIGQYRTDRIQEELQVVLLKDLQVQCYSELRFWEDCGYPLLDESF